MKRLFSMAFLLCFFTGGVYAQVVDTTVCDVLKNPKSFDGKMVRIKGTVVTGLDQFVVNGGDCGLQVNGIWLAYPQGSKGKAGPLAMLELEPAHNFSGTPSAEKRTPVTLTRDKEFKQFDSLLTQPHNKGMGMCLGCPRYDVQATLVGRLDGVADATLLRSNGKIVGLGGFGNMNAYPARLVLQSVSDVTPKEVDYSKSDAITKGDATTPAPDAGYFDPLASAQKVAAALGPSVLTTQIQKDAAVYPKPKEQNGVSIGFKEINEVSPNEGALGAEDSPDGVLYLCTFNRDRLQSRALTVAIIHVGQHVSDVREPAPGNEAAPPVISENNAWVVAAATAIPMGEKFFVLPGGYVMWNSAWPEADRSDNMKAALDSFLAQEARLTR